MGIHGLHKGGVLLEVVFHPTGAHLFLENLPGVRTIAVGFWIKIGSRQEHEDEAGIAHLLEHMVFKGTKKRSGKDIALIFDRLGGDVNAYTTKEYTAFVGRFLPEHLAEGTALLLEMISAPKCKDEELRREREVILEELAQVSDDPVEVVHDLGEALFFGEHPLARPIIGREETIQRMTCSKLCAFWHAHYRPENLVVVLVGALDSNVVAPIYEIIDNTLKRWAQRHQEDSPSTLLFAKNPQLEMASDETTPMFHSTVYDASMIHANEWTRTDDRYKRINWPDLAQSHLLYVFPGLPFGHPDMPILSVLNTMLGGSMSSRLYQVLREEEGLVYDVYTDAVYYKDHGYLKLYAATRSNLEHQVRGHIQTCLESIRTKGFRADEIDLAKETLRSALILAADGPLGRLEKLGVYGVYGMNVGHLEDEIERLMRVQLEDVHRLLQIMLAHSPVLAIVGREPADA